VVLPRNSIVIGEDPNSLFPNTAIHQSSEEAYDTLNQTNQPVAFAALDIQDSHYPSNGVFVIGSGEPSTSNSPLRNNYKYRFFLRTYPLDVSLLLLLVNVWPLLILTG